jgi:ATP-dependent Clp protease ATP-binding subunit ClpB
MPIRWDKFTVKAQEAVQRANELASEHGNPELQPAHLLAALLEDKEGIVPPVLEKIGIGPQAVLSEIYREIEKLPKVSGQAAQATLSNEVNKLLEDAFKEASKTNTFPPNTCCLPLRTSSAIRRSRSWRVTARPTTPS